MEDGAPDGSRLLEDEGAARTELLLEEEGEPESVSLVVDEGKDRNELLVVEVGSAERLSLVEDVGESSHKTLVEDSIVELGAAEGGPLLVNEDAGDTSELLGEN